ncbi:MAG: T9SS type A sorting domain-containing protein [Cytophagales bacterium]|nr:T9SS type A sorting domain-containing protein [Cytophagales bacterium]
MKKLLAIITLALAFSTSSFAQEPTATPIVKLISQPQASKFKVIYIGNESEKVKIKISDAEGTVVFSESIQETSFIRPYVLKNLPKGLYKLTVTNRTGKQELNLIHQEKRTERLASAQ